LSYPGFEWVNCSARGACNVRLTAVNRTEQPARYTTRPADTEVRPRPGQTPRIRDRTRSASAGSRLHPGPKPGAHRPPGVLAYGMLCSRQTFPATAEQPVSRPERLVPAAGRSPAAPHTPAPYPTPP